MQIYEKRTRYTNFRLFINAVEQRTRYLVHITLYLSGGTAAIMGRVVVVATRTWVHRGYEHKGAGELDGVFGTRYCYLMVFEWLAQHLQGLLVKLGQLTQEKRIVP